MAINTNAISTYTTTALNDRDVANYITNVSPTDSPFFSMIGESSAFARLKEEPVDTLSAANGNNALVEGDVLTSNTAPTAKSTESNSLQIFKKTIEVTGTQEIVNKYGGIKSELQYQVKKRYTELATDVEAAFITGTAATGGASTARTLTGLTAKVTTNTATAFASASIYTSTAAADIAAFEVLLNDMFQLGFTTGQQFDTVLVGAKLKRRISALTTNVTRYVGAQQYVQSAVINIYESDFGTMNIILDRYVPSVWILAVKKDMCSTAYLRKWDRIPLAKTNDSTQVSIVGELTLSVRTEKAIGSVNFV